MTRLDYERARRTRKADYGLESGPLFAWHRRNNKFSTPCHVCGNPVAAGSALMRKAGERWQVAHTYHKDIAST
jgi:hypothetical protein